MREGGKQHFRQPGAGPKFRRFQTPTLCGREDLTETGWVSNYLRHVPAGQRDNLDNRCQRCVAILESGTQAVEVLFAAIGDAAHEAREELANAPRFLFKAVAEAADVQSRCEEFGAARVFGAVAEAAALCAAALEVIDN